MSKTIILDGHTSDACSDNQLVSKNTTSFKLKGIAFAVLGGALMLSGCATKPVYQNAGGPNIQVNARGVPNFYKVQSGDTVSEIAARYGLNYRQLGALNRLDSRYTIYAGQWLKLWEGGNMAPPVSVNRAQPVRNAPTYSAPPVQNNRPAPQTSNGVSATGYTYPTTNPVTKNFNASTGEMSMWFSGRTGDPIVASKSGQVLYAGNGLPEYGNLVMIRHDDRYITVYAHNEQLFVKEGDRVQTGQRIASMGSSGQTSQVGLEFQVREDGSPVDPRGVLGL